KEQYESISVADLKEFYQRCFFSANTSVYLSGNPTEKVISLVREKFGDVCWGTSTDPGPIKQVEPVSDVEKFQFIESADALQNAVRMGFVTIPQQHPDFEGLYVLTTLLGGYFGSRLMSNIREDKGYTYGIDAGLIPLPSESVFVIGTQCDVKYVKPLIQEVYHEFDRLKTELVSQEELDMVKNYMLGELARRSEGLYLCDVYTTAEIQGLPDDYLQKRVDAIQRVTVQDIHDLACKYLLPEKVKEVVVGKKI
ncbi:MAG: insulinase family protein, partial [Bacteroidales bacterium]|nr:insulinase family protein [Bacteroidales bacterium]